MNKTLNYPRSQRMKKVRKPKDLKFTRLYFEYPFSEITIQIKYFDLASSKKLHAWLTKVIKYLESR
jgi:hypothetical protein